MNRQRRDELQKLIERVAEEATWTATEGEWAALRDDSAELQGQMAALTASLNNALARVRHAIGMRKSVHPSQARLTLRQAARMMALDALGCLVIAHRLEALDRERRESHGT
jgi:hypothetical protein